jgi:dTDP-4-dehydrorhamnose reductase
LPQVEVAYICAAISRMKECEDDPSGTSYINVEQTRRLIDKLCEQGTRVIFLSSSQVFDGFAPQRTIHDASAPRSEYGRQKLCLEQWLMQRSERATVLRLSKAPAHPFPLFAAWENKLRSGETISAFDDLYIAPIPVPNVAEAALRIAEHELTGYQHVSGAEDISYYEIALRLASCLQVAPAKIIKEHAAEAGIAEFLRPRYTTMRPTADLADLTPTSAWAALALDRIMEIQ